MKLTVAFGARSLSADRWECSMGYQAYISKESELYTTDDGGIARHEWMSLIDSDKELFPKESIESVNPSTGERIRISLRDAAVWSAGNEDEIIFSLASGRIEMPYPEGETRAKAKEIAATLGGTLFGEEGERI